MTTPAKKGRFLKIAGLTVGGLAALLVVVYFTATSAWFLKSVILPKVGKAVNANITLEDASISPFSAVTLTGLKVQTTGADPLVTVQEIRLRYSLTAILGGNIKVDEITVLSPVITVTQNADGTSNYDPLLQSSSKSEPAKPKSSEPIKLDLSKLDLKDAKVKFVQVAKDGTRTALDVTDLNFSLADLGNGKSGKLSVKADVKVDQTQSVTNNSKLQVRVGGDFGVALDNQLMPASIKGGLQLDVGPSLGQFGPLSGLVAALDCELTPTDLKNVALKLSQAGKNYGTVTVNGPLNLVKLEGKLHGDITAIDRQVLNLVGKAFGIDFNSTTISSTGDVELAQGGQLIQVKGGVTAAKFSVTQLGQTTPELNVSIGYDLSVDRAAQMMVVRSFNLNGLQQQRELLKGALTKPMTVAFGKGANAVDESAFSLAIQDLNLADWRAFAAGTEPAGKVNIQLNLLSRQAGKQLKVDLKASLADFAAKMGTNKLSLAAINLTLDTDVSDFNKVTVNRVEAVISQPGQPALTFQGKGKFDTQTQDADGEATAQAFLVPLIAIAGVPDLKLTSGSLAFNGRVVQKNLNPKDAKNLSFERTVQGAIKVDNLSGNLSGITLDQFEFAADCDIAMKDTLVEIKKLLGTLKQRQAAGGSLEVKGSYDLKKEAGQVSLKVVDINQNVLSSFLAAALGDKKLQSVSINLDSSGTFNLAADSAFKADLSLANLVVNDPKGGFPGKPLEARLLIDASLKQKRVELRQLALKLTPTERAANQLNLSGNVDATRSNAITGTLKLQADALDLTPYYDLVADKPASKEPEIAKTDSTPQKTEQEPAPVTLPLSNFVFNADIGRIFLREIAISNLVMALKLDGSKVDLSRFAMHFNGAPVDARAALDLGLPGYKYDLGLKAQRIPAEPIVNTFSPASKGLVKGDVIADIAVKGAGTTGKNLKANLGGNVMVSFTNANIVVHSTYSKALLMPISIVLNEPALLKSPIDFINADVALGNGNIDLRQFIAHSPLLKVVTQGVIPIADIFTNSPLNQPVEVWLARNFASKFSLPSAADATHVKLPNFVQLKGTLGVPDVKTDKFVITGLMAVGVTGALGGKASGVVKDVGGLLGGFMNRGTTATTTATNVPTTITTNVPAVPSVPTVPTVPVPDTNKPAIKLLNGFLKGLQK